MESLWVWIFSLLQLISVSSRMALQIVGRHKNSLWGIACLHFMGGSQHLYLQISVRADASKFLLKIWAGFGSRWQCLASGIGHVINLRFISVFVLTCKSNFKCPPSAPLDPMRNWKWKHFIKFCWAQPSTKPDPCVAGLLTQDNGKVHSLFQFKPCPHILPAPLASVCFLESLTQDELWTS